GRPTPDGAEPEVGPELQAASNKATSTSQARDWTKWWQRIAGTSARGRRYDPPATAGTAPRSRKTDCVGKLSGSRLNHRIALRPSTARWRSSVIPLMATR